MKVFWIQNYVEEEILRSLVIIYTNLAHKQAQKAKSKSKETGKTNESSRLQESLFKRIITSPAT